jgi:CRISPR-associated protein Csh1
LYKSAISIKKEKFDLLFSFGVLKTFFEEDFYDLIQKVFMLQPISNEALYTKFMKVIRANYNKMQTSDGYVEMTYLTILKAHLTHRYFQELGLIDHNPNYKLMETFEQAEKKSSFDLEKLKKFIEENKGFLDSEYKVGIFSVGILVRLLINIQQVNLGNTPFEKKLKGYNISPELLKNIYIEALNKISQYQGFYAYSNLREFIDQYFILNINKVSKISNNELSFYFVAGLEFGNQFKNREVKEEILTTN